MDAKELYEYDATERQLEKERERGELMRPTALPSKPLRGADGEPLRVVRAAILDQFGGVHSVPRPGRHHDVIAEMVKSGIQPPIGPSKYEQGFLLSDGRFVNRKAAARVAIKAGQCAKVELPGRGLLSEDVW